MSRPAFAVVGLLLSLAVTGWAVSSSFFFSDDFLNFARASEVGFRAWVQGELFGHWLPARKTLDWGLNTRPLSWPAAVTVLLEFVGVTALLTRLAVVRVTRSPFWANIALVALPLTATIPGTAQWWAGAAQVIPATTCAMLVAVVVLWLPEVAGRLRAGGLVLIAVALGAGLLFDERTAVIALLAPLLVPLVASGRAVRVTLLWSYGVMIPVLAVWYWLQSHHTTSDGHVSSIGTILVFIAKAVVQNAAPALVGWVTRPALNEDALWLVGAVVLVALAFGVLRSRRPGRAAWLVAVWLAAVVGTSAPAAIVRAEEFGVSAALEPRYMTLAMPLGLIAAVGVLALLPAPTRIGRRVLAGVATVAAAAVAVNLVHLHDSPLGLQARAWVDTVRASAEAQGVTIFYNSRVPEYVVPIAFYPYDLTAELLPQILSHASDVVTGPSAGLVMADGSVAVVTPTPVGSARLLAATGLSTAPGADGRTCYTAGVDGGRLSYALPTTSPTGGSVVVDVQGSFADTGLRVATGPTFDALRDKTHGVGGSPPVPGSTHWVTTDELPDAAMLAIEIDPGQGLCVTDVAIGVLPATS